MNKLLILGLLLIITSCSQGTGYKNIDSKKVGTTFNTEKTIEDTSVTDDKRKHETFNEPIDTLPAILKTFIPTGYAVINISSGDADLDGLIDKVLVLRKNDEETTSNYAENKPDKRPLLLLLRKPDHSYKIALRNDNAVYCIDCGGVFGDPFTGTTIKNGYFSIEHGIAGGEHWKHVITFKFDKMKANWFLYKDHYISYKFNDSKNENAEALVVDIDKLETIKDFGIISFDQFNIYNKTGR